MDLFAHVLDGFIHTIWDQNIIHTTLYLFIQSSVLIFKQDSDGRPILDQNIDILCLVDQYLFNRRVGTTGHYSVVYDEVYTIGYGSIC